MKTTKTSIDEESMGSMTNASRYCRYIVSSIEEELDLPDLI